MLNMGLFIIIVLSAISTSYIYLVLRNGEFNLKKIYFILICLSLVIWNFANYFSNQNISTDLIIWSNRIIFFSTATCLLSIFLYAFEDVKIKINVYLLYFVYALTILNATTSLYSDLFIKKINIFPNYSSIEFGPFLYPFLFQIAICMLPSLWVLLSGYLKNKNNFGKQNLIVFIGLMLLLVLTLTFNLIIPLTNNNFTLTNIGLSVATLCFNSAIAYAILAHQLFNIRIIIQRTTLYSLLFGSMLMLYSLMILLFFGTNHLFGLNESITIGNLITNLLIALCVGLSFEKIRHWLRNFIDTRLFKKEYAQQQSVHELTAHLNRLINLHEVLEQIMQTTAKILNYQKAVIFVFQPGPSGATDIKTIKYIGYNNPKKLILEEEDQVAHYFSKNNDMIFVDSFRHDLNRAARRLDKNSESTRNYYIKNRVLKKLETMDADIVIPLQIKDQLIGLLILSDKKGSNQLNQNELQLLETIRSLAINSIDKSFVYELDQQKNLFVSIASHELLTPLTAVEGYLSMILEEGQGKIDSKVKQYLDRVFHSSRRLSVLIEDLLSVSRIESGSLKIEAQALNIEALVQESLDQLKSVAEQKNIQINIHIIENNQNKIPKIWADPDRTMQVIINLISNAIKYTPKGSIEIDISHDPSSLYVAVEVKDSGIGMSSEQQEHLFQKFYRVASKETESIVGTGLGLYITKAILDKMHCIIKIKSELGKGTCFKVDFPLFKAQVVEME